MKFAEITLLGGKVLFQLKYVTCFPEPGAALPLPISSERVTSASSVPYLQYVEKVLYYACFYLNKKSQFKIDIGVRRRKPKQGQSRQRRRFHTQIFGLIWLPKSRP